MREINKISEALFEKIRSRFDNVSLGDENAKSVQDPDTGEMGYTVTEFGMQYYEELYKEQIAKLN